VAVLVSQKTCRYMQEMFKATVSWGTARKAFYRSSRDRVLRHLVMGGKTGTLRGADRQNLYEWFAGYAVNPNTGRTLAIGAVVAHGKQKRTEPDFIARYLIKRAFETAWGSTPAKDKEAQTAQLRSGTSGRGTAKP
jgi:peptidoglycan glycosyltransferase